MEEKLDDGTCKLCRYAIWYLPRQMSHRYCTDDVRITDIMREEEKSRVKILTHILAIEREPNGICVCDPASTTQIRKRIATTKTVNLGGDSVLSGVNYEHTQSGKIDFNHPRCRFYEEDADNKIEEFETVDALVDKKEPLGEY